MLYQRLNSSDMENHDKHYIIKPLVFIKNLKY